MSALTANLCRSHLTPPSHSRLPPDGHEFPPDCSDSKTVVDKVVSSKMAVDIEGHHRVASKSHSGSSLLSSEFRTRLLRHDEKSVKSVRDKIALFSKASTNDTNGSVYSRGCSNSGSSSSNSNNNNNGGGDQSQSSEDVNNRRFSPPPLTRAHTHADVRYNSSTNSTRRMEKSTSTSSTTPSIPSSVRNGGALRSQKSVSSADLYSACFSNVRRVSTSQRFTTIPSGSTTPIVNRSPKYDKTTSPSSRATSSRASSSPLTPSPSSAQRSQSLMEIGLAGLAGLADSILLDDDSEKHSQTLPKRSLITHTPIASSKKRMMQGERKTSLGNTQWQMPKFEDELPLVLTAQPWRDSYRIKQLEQEDKENLLTSSIRARSIRGGSSSTVTKEQESSMSEHSSESEHSSHNNSEDEGDPDQSNAVSHVLYSSDQSRDQKAKRETNYEDKDDDDGSNDDCGPSGKSGCARNETLHRPSFDAFEGGGNHSRLLADRHRSHVRMSNSSVENCKSSTFSFIGKPASRSSSFSFADNKRSVEGFQPYHKTSDWRRRSQESLWSSRRTLTEDPGCISSLLSSEDTIGEEQEINSLNKSSNSTARPETEGGSRDTTPTRNAMDGGCWPCGGSDKLQLSRTSSLSSEKSLNEVRPPSSLKETKIEEEEESEHAIPEPSSFSTATSSSVTMNTQLKRLDDEHLVELENKEIELITNRQDISSTSESPSSFRAKEPKEEESRDLLLSDEGVEWTSFDASNSASGAIPTENAMSTPVFDDQHRLLAPLVFRPDEALRSPRKFEIGDVSSSSSVFILHDDDEGDDDSDIKSNESRNVGCQNETGVNKSNEDKRNKNTDEVIVRPSINNTTCGSTGYFNAITSSMKENVSSGSRRCVSVSDIRRAFEKAEASLATKDDDNDDTGELYANNKGCSSSSALSSTGIAPSHHRMSSLDSTASDESSSIPTPIFLGSVSSLQSQANVRDHYGSISSLASSTSLISPQELQLLIEDANQSLEESGTPSHEIMVVVLHREFTAGSLGITLAGGADYESKEITVHKVIPGTLADRDGRIQKGDRVLSINGKSTKGVTHREALTTLKAPRPEVVLVVSRSRSVTPALESSPFSDRSSELSSPSSGLTSNNSFTINLSSSSRPPKILESPLDSKSLLSDLKFVDVPRAPPMTVMLTKEGTGLGFSLEGGKDSPVGDRPLTIKKIFAGGSAAKSKVLGVGDEIIAVNNVDCTGMSRIEAWNFMKTLPDGTAVLTVRQKIGASNRGNVVKETPNESKQNNGKVDD